MKALLAGCILTCGFSACAQAETFNRTAVSGVSTVVAHYYDWDPNSCQSLPGTVKLLAKPQHGKLSTRYVDWVISKSRYTGTTSVCAGTRTKAFQITYRSQPGFSGVDSFTVHVAFGFKNMMATDVYSINVQ
jgi:opacity protein-like surface antigen